MLRLHTVPPDPNTQAGKYIDHKPPLPTCCIHSPEAAGYPQGADVQEDGQASKDGQSEQGGSGQDAGPGSSGDVETSALSEAQTYLLQGYYVVKKGDSLVGISKKIYGNAKKAKKICDLNGIEDMDKIFVGQKLELP